MKRSIIVHIQRPEKPAFNYTVGEKMGLWAKDDNCPNRLIESSLP
jgi:hypothetical protein